MSDAIPVVLFRSVEGSMTSDDGQTVYLRATEPDGADVMFGFPHGEILNMVECLAVQADKGKDKRGRKITTAFKAISFEVGRGPEGEPVLSLVMGETGKINYLLEPAKVAQLMDGLAGFRLKH
jgi:hypothetical protein